MAPCELPVYRPALPLKIQSGMAVENDAYTRPTRAPLLTWGMADGFH